MTARHALAVLLAVVALAAAVLSFAALRDLALLCGFSRSLAWLLPVVVDAGAAAGSLVWLGGRAPDSARRFAQRLALVLLGSSVAANALSHGLAAYGLRPPWWVVVLVSGVAPAVLGAVVHLAVLCGRAEAAASTAASSQRRLPDLESLSEASPAGGDQREPDCATDSVPADVPVALHSVPSPTPPGVELGDVGDPVAALVAAGAGWRKVQEATGLSEYHAKKRVREHRETSG